MLNEISLVPDSHSLFPFFSNGKASSKKFLSCMYLIYHFVNNKLPDLRNIVMKRSKYWKIKEVNSWIRAFVMYKKSKNKPNLVFVYLFFFLCPFFSHRLSSIWGFITINYVFNSDEYIAVVAVAAEGSLASCEIHCCPLGQSQRNRHQKHFEPSSYVLDSRLPIFCAYS